MLVYLLERRDRIVTKIELMDEIWGDRFVSEAAITTCIRTVRKAVGDDGRRQEVIKTAHGHGYRFIAPVEELTGQEPDRSAVDEGADRPTAEPASQGVAVVGRQRELDEIAALLERGRLVALVGPGGIGKTHLLRAVAASAATADGDIGPFADGVAMAELAEVRSSDDVGAAVLEAVGGSEIAGVPAATAVTRHLAAREVLLLIDNVEHVRPATADLCRSILDRCPGVAIVVTSRQRLNLIGEAVCTIGPLDLDAAVELFVDHARNVGSDLDGGAPDVRELCVRLDGVPLALVLLAARTRLLSVGDLSDQVGPQLAFESGSLPGNRHGSVEAALRWSFDSLDEQARRLIGDLTIFAGPFDLAAAEAISPTPGAAPRLLELCEKSLVVADTGGERSRFRLLEPVRLFGERVVGAGPGADARHAGHYRSVVEELAARFETPDIDRALTGFRREWPNIRRAFLHDESRDDLEAMTRLVVLVSNYADARLISEVNGWAARTVALATRRQAPIDDELAATAARLVSHTGDLERVAELTAGIDRRNPSSHVAIGLLVGDWLAGRHQRALDLLDVVLAREEGTGGYWELSYSLLRIAATLATGRDPGPVVDRLAVLADLGGEVAGFGRPMADGVRALQAGDPVRAVDRFGQAVARAEAARCAGIAQLIRVMRVGTLNQLRDPGLAARAVVESLDGAGERGAWALTAMGLGTTVRLLAEIGEAATAARVVGALRAAGHLGVPTGRGSSIDRLLDDRLGGAAADHLAQGGLLSVEQATGLALAALRSFLDRPDVGPATDPA